MQCRRMPKQLRDWEAYTELKKNVEDFLDVLPLLQMLCSSAMRTRHWVGIQAAAGTNLDIASDHLLLGDVLNMCLQMNPDDVEEICNAALKELEIESKLKALREDWADTRFEFQNFKNKGPVLLRAKELHDILDKLEESSVVLSQMASNKHSVPFKEQVDQCSVELASVSEVIELWSLVQSSWVYMEAVFLSGDITKQLPQEAKRFAGIDKSYMQLTAKAFEVPSVIQCCHGSEAMKLMLPHVAEQLELCQRSLKGYLEAKRRHFPRFYFISDNSLLEILSHGPDVAMVAGHFRHLFDSMTDVAFDKGKKDVIVSMSSGEGEEVHFTQPLEIKGDVVEYLNDIVATMQSTLRDMSRDCVAEIASLNLEKFVKMFPSQTCILGLMILWTDTVNDGLVRAKTDRNALPVAMKKAGVVLHGLVSMAAKPMSSKMQRVLVQALVVTQVYLTDTVQDLQAAKVRSVYDFEWQRQLRSHYDPEGKELEFNTSICDASLPHTFEHLGCKERIVITPMTSRCWISLTQSVNMFLGFSAVGPPGTGKTETIKEFGRNISKYVAVFNCSDQMDQVSLGKIFKGIAIGGCWGCFDDFNRISVQVLSVASQQLNCVLTALRERRKEFIYTDGQHTNLHRDAGFLVTMNHVGEGRSELPESLKMLFRSVAALVPNTQLIVRVKLGALGYLDAPALAKKVEAVMIAAAEQLSRAAHYDFGLRTTSEVLRTLARVRQAKPPPKEPRANYDVSQLMSALRSALLPRLLPEDVPLFLSIIDDVIPAGGIEAWEDTAAAALLAEAANGLSLQHGTAETVEWDHKLLQCYDTVSSRHGIALIGPTNGGKSSILDTVAAAMTASGAKQNMVRINPKTLTPTELFGSLSKATEDWIEGAFVVLWRKALRATACVTWILLDGPVDVLWAENLNAVLDDTKMLTIANGDRYPVADRVKIIFETGHLSSASPTTVSRTGIVHVGAQALSWKAVANAWLKHRSAKVMLILKDMMFRLVTGGLEAVGKQSPLPTSYSPTTLVHNMLALLAVLLRPIEASKSAPRSDHVERLVLFSLYWTTASMLERDQRHRYEADLRRYSALLPAAEAGGLGDNHVSKDGAWVHFKTIVPKWVSPHQPPRLGRVVIPTLDNTVVSWLITTMSMSEVPVLLTGGPGVSKTSNALSFLHKLPKATYAIKHLALCSATQVSSVRIGVASCVEKRQARTYAPPGGKICYLMIDDMCCPKPNQFGDQEPCELVRQMMHSGGYYNPSKAGEWRVLTGIRWIATMRHANAGKARFAPSERLTSLFFPINVVALTPTGVESVFGQILRGHLSSDLAPPELAKDTVKLVDATQSVCARITQKLLPTPVKLHYQFDIRQIARVMQGMMMCSLESLDGRELMIRLWRHECERVFVDSLSTQDDKEWARQVISQVVEDTFGPKIAKSVRETGVFVNFMSDQPQQELDREDSIDMEMEEAPPVGAEGGVEEAGREGDEDDDEFDGTPREDARKGSRGGRSRGSDDDDDGMDRNGEEDEDGEESPGVSPRRAFNSGVKASVHKAKTVDPDPAAASAATSVSKVKIAEVDLNPPHPSSTSGRLSQGSFRKKMSMRNLNDTGAGLGSGLLAMKGGSKVSTDMPLGPVDGIDVQRYESVDEREGAERRERLDGESNEEEGGGRTERDKVASGFSFPGVVADDDAPLEREPTPLAIKVLYSYEHCASKEELRARLDDFVLQHDMSVEGMREGCVGLVMFDAAVEHLVQICRAISLEGGSCLLVGLGGSGRFTLARLAAYIQGHETMVLSLPERSKSNGWAEEMRRAVRMCVTGQSAVSVIINSADTREEGLYDCLNQLIATGEAVDLFSRDEMEALNTEAVARNELSDAGLGQDLPHASPVALLVSSRLRVTACFASHGHTTALAKTLFAFPSLHNQCQVIYFLPWSADSLAGLAESKLIDMDTTVSDSLDVISKHMAHVYTAVDAIFTKEREDNGRHIYATPRSYRAYVEQFVAVFERANNASMRQSSDIVQALQKLEDATQDIEDMKVEIAESEIVLVGAQRASADMLKEISGLSTIADKKKSEMLVFKTAADSQMAVMQMDQAAIDQALKAAQPAFDEAEEVLRGVTPKDIQTLKGLKNPPAVARLLMDAVLIIKHRTVIKVAHVEDKGVNFLKDSWTTSSIVMVEPNFIESLITFDRQALLNDETMELLQPYLSCSLVTFDSAKKVGGLVTALFHWVMAVNRYHELVIKERPKMLAVNEQLADYTMAKHRLASADEEYQAAQHDVDRVQTDFEEKFALKKQVQDETESTKRKMMSATTLLEALAEEKKKWTTETTLLEVQKQRVVGDSLVAAAFLAFCGQLTVPLRERLLRFEAIIDLEARDMPVTGNLSMTRFLTDEAEVGAWQQQGLSTDEVSVHNAIIVTRSVRWPLILDPHRLGFEWIKLKHESDGGIKVVSLNEKRFRGVLEDCLMYGKPLLIEHASGPLSLGGTLVESVADIKWIISPKGGRSVMIKGTEVPVDDKFMLYVVTQLENPTISPEMGTRLTVVNFGVTHQGLEELLLHQVVKAERPDLYGKRHKNVEEINKCMLQVKVLEKEILARLSGSFKDPRADPKDPDGGQEGATGNLLEEVALIDALSNCKKSLREQQEKLKVGPHDSSAGARPYV